MACVFYFRGLNTYAEDHVRVGPIRAGTMYGPLQDAFRSQDIEFIPLLDMKTGRLAGTTARAKELLLSHPEWRRHDAIDFFAHSTGALIARALLHENPIREKVRSLISLGAPHQGVPAADRLTALALGNSSWLRLAKIGGWDWQKREEIIKDLSPASVAEFNRRFTDIEGIRYACHLCSCPPQQLSLVMKFFEMVVTPPFPNDGLIPLESQRRGEVLGEFTLDHFTQLGYFPFTGSRQKIEHRREFLRMVQTSVDFWRSLEVPP